MHDAKKTLWVTPSPHLTEGTRTSTIMWSVALSLLPALGWGVYVFGWQALVTVVLCIGSALLTELVINWVRRKITILDGSAFLTGLLIGLNLPPAVPVYVPIAASVFALAIVKHAFGGLGANWMNPALAGRVFALFSFSKVMNVWPMPATLPVWRLPGAAADAITGASPLGTVKAGLVELANQAGDPAMLASRLQGLGGPASLLAAKQYPVTPFDAQVTQFLNHLFGGHLQRGYIDLFVGNVAGSIGEISTLLLVLGAAFLFIRKIISWEIPVAYLGSFALLVWVLGGLNFASGLFHGDAVFHLLTGGVVFGAFFMATDYVTSPMTRTGKIIFGIGAGLLTFLIRFYGSLPEGVSLAIIIMNMFVPLIDRFLKPKIFGTIPEKKT
jgi:electron transport complex protein RnfD